MLYFLNQNESNACYNACEMGLGKCAMATTCLNALNIYKFIIISPAVMRLTWANELKNWYEFKERKEIVRKVNRTLVINRDRGIWEPVDDIEEREVTRGIVVQLILKRQDLKNISKNSSVIISYDLATSDEFIDYVKQTDGMYEALILDEAHYLKSKKAKRTKAILNEIWPKCKYKIALSGTPFTQSVIDGYTLFSKMLPSKFTSFTQFANRYSYQQMTPWGPKYFGVKNSEELSSVIRSNFYIRYKKEDVLTDLPEKIYTKITLPTRYSVEADPATQVAMQKAIEGIQDGKAVSVMGSLATHKRAQGLAKVPAIVEYTQHLLEQDIPVVVFAYHRDVIGQLKVDLKKYNPVVITGDTNAKDRQDHIQAFQEGRTNLFIGNLTAAGVGITLTRSSNVVLGELDWSPAIINQAVDRCHRIGQKDAVNVHYFCVQNSIDEDLIETVMNKARTFKKVVD